MSTTTPTTTNPGTATTPPASTPPVTPSNPSPTTTTPVAPTTYKPTNNTVAVYGEKSKAVLDLQNKLRGMGAQIDADSMYGPETQKAYDKYMGSGNATNTGSNTAGVSANASTTPATDTTVYVDQHFADTHDMNNPYYKNYKVRPAETTTPTTNADGTPKTQDQIDAEALSKQRLADAQAVHDQILGIQNGTIPLSEGDQAQIEGLKQQFQQMLDQQKLTNVGAEGLANVRGFQTGAAEYDANFAVKTIGSIITAGANKITDLNIKMASAVATLTQALKDNKIEGIKSAYNILETARKDRQATIEKTIADTQKIIKEQQDKKDAITKDVNAIAEEVAKNGGDAKLRALVSSSPDVATAIANAGDYLQTGTGTLGDYLQYKRATIAKGLTPMDYMAFKDNEDKKAMNLKINEAYATAKASARGKAAGTVPGMTVDENGNVITTGNLSALDIGRYNLAATRATKTFRDTQVFKAATNAGFYIAKIKAATEGTGSIQDQEILDSISQFNTGGGRVTEAQVNIILKGKSLNDTMNTWANKLKNGGILSNEQRKQALQLANETAKQFSKNYEEKYTPLAKNLEKQKIPKEFWGIPTPEQLKGEVGTDAKSQVDSYVSSHPEKAETIAKLYEIPGATDQDVLDYVNLTENNKI